MRKPIISLPEYVSQHEKQRDHLKRYMTTKRGRSAVDEFTANNFKHSAALSLKATNLDARIAVGMAAHKVLSKKRNRHEHPFMLTLCPARFAVPILDAPNYDINIPIEWLKRKLGGTDHITVVDLAYFSNFPARPHGEHGCIHFHGHSIIWDDTAATDLQMDLEENYEPLIRGRSMFHSRFLKQGDVPGRGLYLFKAPLNEYRAIAEVKPKTDDITGETFKVPTGNYNQKKRALRPGDAAKMSRILSGWDIPSLTFAGGKGTPILEEILRKAKKYVVQNEPKPERDYFAGI